MTEPKITIQRIPKHRLTLHGVLTKYGTEYEFGGRTPRQLIKVLLINFPEACADIRDHAWEVVVGDLDGGMRLGADQLEVHLGNQGIHLVPVCRADSPEAKIYGAGGRGGGKAIMGAVILGATVMSSGLGTAMAAGYFDGATISAAMSQTAFAGMSYGSIAAFGGAMMLSGAASMLSAAASAGDTTTQTADTNASYLFNGIQNTSAQGAAVPLVYGKCMTGSVLVSAGLTTEAG